MVNQLTKPKNKSPAKPKSKKLKPASVTAQKAWQKFPAKLKKELRKSLPDTDKDKVPDGFDCRPRNRKKQESFLDDDARYLSQNPKIELGEYLGCGLDGMVYSVKGNPNLAVKVPRGFADTCYSTASSRRRKLYNTEHALKCEATDYEDFNFESKALVSPMKATKLYSDVVSRDVIALVRPRVNPVFDYSQPVDPKYLHRLTPSCLEELRRKIIHLSHEGFLLTDGLQIGFDRAGRLLLYDQGCIKKHDAGIGDLFTRNNNTWLFFLHTVLNLPGFTNDQRNELSRKYGTINRDEYY